MRGTSRLSRFKKAPRSYDAVWRFVNSAFGLWCLSAVFISGAGAVFTRWYAARDAAAFNQQRIHLLDEEISYRLSLILAELYAARERLAKADVQTQKLEIERITAALETPPKTSGPGLYPEFSNHPMAALLSELERRIGQDDDDWHDVDTSLQVLANGPFDYSTYPLVVGPFEAAAGQIHVNFHLERWTLFAYTRCTPDDPWCDGPQSPVP